MGGGKVQSSRDLVSASPMQPDATLMGLDDLKPTRVEIATAHDVPKK